MTKAKEALDIFNKVDTGILESFDGKYKHILPPYYLKTIREALELLDKVERGGCKGDFTSIFVNEVNGIETVYVPFEDLDKYIPTGRE